MAERRMISLPFVDSDAFLDMPNQARLLYYDLCLRGDDDGFIDSPKKVLRITGASEDDLKTLIEKDYIISFDSGVIVIKHWRIHNFIRKDMYHETKCKAEKATLYIDDDNIYTQHLVPKTDTLQPCNEPVTNSSPKDRLGKERIGKDRLKKENKEKESTEIPYGEIVDYLNEKAEKNYKVVDSVKTLIAKRFSEGFSFEDFKTVIDVKCSKWKNDEKMNPYLRPETLFGIKFQNYLNEKPVKHERSYDLEKAIKEAEGDSLIYIKNAKRRLERKNEK